MNPLCQRLGSRLAVGMILLLVACSSPTDTPAPPAEPVAETITEPESAAESDAPPEATAAESDAPPEATAAVAEASNRPEWQTVPLTDVRTGETFTLADFDEQVVILETMAVWCPFCDQQQLQIKSALGELGDQAVVVSLDVDPGETADIVIRHADRLELPWRFAIAGPELSRMLQNEFGPQVLTPPSTPVLIIAPDGTTELTPSVIKGWDELVSLVEAYLP